MSTPTDHEGVCPSCGFDEHCGCPMDTHTMALMRCPSCGGEWWRAWGDDSIRCLHKRCGVEGSEVAREPLYAPHGAEEAGALLCGQCKTAPVYKPDAIWPDGKPGLTALYCYGCIDRCHEATDFAHICQICASPEEARARGWEVTR